MWHSYFFPVGLSFLPHPACNLCYCYFQVLKNISMLSSTLVFEKSTQREEMAGKTNSPIMLNVQSLCNRAMKKIPSNTCFNIQKILQWKKTSAVCFAVFFSCNIQLHLFFSPEYFPFNVRSHTQGKSNCKIAFSLERLLFYIFS